MPAPLKVGQRVFATLEIDGKFCEVRCVIAKESTGNGYAVVQADENWRVLDGRMLTGVRRDWLSPVDDPPRKPRPSA